MKTVKQNDTKFKGLELRLKDPKIEADLKATSEETLAFASYPDRHKRRQKSKELINLNFHCNFFTSSVVH